MYIGIQSVILTISALPLMSGIKWKIMKYGVMIFKKGLTMNNKEQIQKLRDNAELAMVGLYLVRVGKHKAK